MPQEGITWTVHSHRQQERSSDWYWALGLGALAAAALCVFFGNVLLGVIIVVGALSIGFLAASAPREHSVRIDGRGVSIDGTLYAFDSLQSFWVERDVPSPRLFLTTSGLLTPHLSLALDGVSPDAVRGYLRRAVAEEPQTPHLGDHVAELLGL